MPTTKPEPKVMEDVAKPGKTTPDATSKPIIVGHKPLLKDPMVTAEEPAVETTPVPKAAPLTVRPDKVITPPSEAQKPEAVPEKTANEAPASDEAAVLEAVAEQAESGKKAPGPSEADKKQQEEIIKLIADKTYFAPIAQTSRRRKNQVASLLGLLLVVLVGGIFAVDANLVDIGVELPFDLIK